MLATRGNYPRSRASLDYEDGGRAPSAAGSRSQRSRRDRDEEYLDDDYEYDRASERSGRRGGDRGGGDNRSDWRDSYDYEYERRVRAPPQARVAATSRSNGSGGGRDSMYSGRSEAPLPPSRAYPDRLVVSPSRERQEYLGGGGRPRTPRTADPFSSEYDSEPPSSPKRYLYPEVVTGALDEKRDLAGDSKGASKKKDEGGQDAASLPDEPQPMNFLPVFSAPKFTQLPGTNAIVELI